MQCHKFHILRYGYLVHCTCVDLTPSPPTVNLGAPFCESVSLCSILCSAHFRQHASVYTLIASLRKCKLTPRMAEEGAEKNCVLRQSKRFIVTFTLYLLSPWRTVLGRPLVVFLPNGSPAARSHCQHLCPWASLCLWMFLLNLDCLFFSKSTQICHNISVPWPKPWLSKCTIHHMPLSLQADIVVSIIHLTI